MNIPQTDLSNVLKLAASRELLANVRTLMLQSSRSRGPMSSASEMMGQYAAKPLKRAIN